MGKQSREKRERLARRSLGEGGREERRFEVRFGLEKACLFIIRWGTCLVLFTPLIINTKFFFPFVAPKTIFFRIAIEIILVAYIFLVMANRRWRPRINVLTVAVTLFLAVFILASFTGVNLERSFWSTNERMTGILTMLHLFAFFIILSSVFKKRQDWERILGVSIIVGVILSCYVLLGSELSTRGGGTIGNTSFMAAYLLFDIFFAIILFLSKRGFWQIFSGVSLAIMLPVLFTSTARGAIISFSVGLFLLFLAYLIFSQRKILKRLGLGIVLTLIIFGIFSAVFQPTFVKNEITITLTEMKSRLVVWETGWQGFQERPILGWGPENFNNVFLKYYNPCMSLPECGSETWFDRSHNIVFDTLVTTGLVGLLSYLAVFGVAIYGLLRAATKIVERRNIFIPLGLAVLLLVYFFQNLLVFDMINTYLVFFLVLGFVSFLIKKETIEEKGQGGRVKPGLAFIVVALMLFVFWTTNIQPLMANYYIIKMVSSQNVTEASSTFEKSLNSWMEKYETREHFAQKMAKSIHQSIPEESKEAFQKAFDLAEIEMEKSITQNSLDFRHYLFLGELYNSSYRFSGNQEKLNKAEGVLEKAIQLSPTNQKGYWQLAETKLSQGKIEETVSLLQTAVKLEPRVGPSHWYLAQGYQIAGDYQLALAAVKKADENGYDWRDTADEIKRVMGICDKIGVDFQSFFNQTDVQMVEHYLRITEKDPNNLEALSSLAALYANLGEYDKARETAEQVLQIDPTMVPQIEEFLKSLPE